MEKRRVIAIGIEGGLLDHKGERDVLAISSGRNRGVLLFGLPKRSEDDAERALNLACRGLGSSLRQTIKEIEVPYDGTSATLDWEAIFAPDLPFLPQGNVLVAPSLAKIYGRVFSFDRREKIGRECFFLEGLREDPKRIRGLTHQHAPLVGRQAELDRFTELLEQSAVDQGQITAVVGEAGIGKTRLVEAFKDIFREKAIPFVQGTCLLRGNAQPYRAFQEIVSQIAGGTITTLSRWEMDDVETDFLRLFLEPTIKIDRLGGLTDEQIRQGLFYAVRKLIHSAARRPLGIVIEDLHWADPLSLELLDYVMDGMETTKLLLVLVHRPKAREAWTQRLNYNEVPVHAFSEEEVDRFIANASGATRVAANVRNELLRVSLGNPLFVEESVRQLVDIGALDLDTDDEGDRVLRLRKRHVEGIPPTLHSLIASRFDRLGKVPREILRWTSLLGSTVDARELQGLIKREFKTELSDELNILLERGYLTEEMVYPKHLYRFHHDLIFEVVHNSLEPDDRHERQAKIGRFLVGLYADRTDEETSRIADHFLDSNDSLSAFEWAGNAGRLSMDLFVYPTAERYLRSAISTWRTLPVSDRTSADSIFKNWIYALLNLGDCEEALRVLQEWDQAGASSNPETEGKYYLLASRLHHLRSNVEKSLESAEKALSSLQKNHAPQDEVYEAKDFHLSLLSRVGQSAKVVHDGLQMLRKLNGQHPLFRFRTFSRLADEATFNGELNQAFEFLAKAERIEIDKIPPEDVIAFQRQYVVVFQESENYKQAAQRATEIIRIAREAGMRDEMFRGMRTRGCEYQELGKYAEALRDLNDALNGSRELRSRGTEAISHFSLIDWYLDIGADEPASKLLEEIDRQFSDKFYYWAENQLTANRAVVALREGNQRESADLFRLGSTQHKKASNELYAMLRAGRAIAIEALYRLRSKEDLLGEYQELRSRRDILRTERAKIYFWILDMELATAGLKVGPIDTNAIELNRIAKCWLRQRAYMVLIQYLAKIGEKKKAKKLLKDYRAHREEIIQNVPEEFHDAFRNHKEYSPDLIQL